MDFHWFPLVFYVFVEYSTLLKRMLRFEISSINQHTLRYMLETYNTIIKLVVRWISHGVQALSILCAEANFQFWMFYPLLYTGLLLIGNSMVLKGKVNKSKSPKRKICLVHSRDSACTASEIHRRTNLMIVLCVSNIYRSVCWLMDDISKCNMRFKSLLYSTKT